MVEGRENVPVTMRCATAHASAPKKGSVPVVIAYSITPIDQQSTSVRAKKKKRIANYKYEKKIENMQ